MESGEKKMVIALFVAIIILTGVLAYSIGIKVNSGLGSISEPKAKDFEYAIIFYPDMKTSIEGYIDKYVYPTADLIRVTIDGTTYETSCKNVIIIKNKTLTINKEDVDDNRVDANQ